MEVARIVDLYRSYC